MSGVGGARAVRVRMAGARTSPALHEPKLGWRARSPSRCTRATRATSDEVDAEAFVDPRIPATIVTGFLGSGKTTLLNRILTEDHKLRIAVIENEFGEIGIDQDLVELKEELEGENIMLLNNGCICCTVREDLVKMIGALVKEKKGKFDHILIETTGLAHPQPIIGTFFREETIFDEVRLDGVVTMVDAKHVMRHLESASEDDKLDEVVEQIAYADKILVNKVDLVDDATVARIEAEIGGINKIAQVQRTTKADVDYRKIFDLGGFDLGRVEDDLLSEEPSAESHHHHHHDHDHEHDHEHGHEHDHGHEDDHGHHGHTHDHSVTSVSVTLPGDMDLDKINDWMGFFLVGHQESVYRMKGILSIKDWREKFIFQGVHAQFEGVPGKEWSEKEERKSVVVFIGKDLDHAAIERELRECLA